MLKKLQFYNNVYGPSFVTRIKRQKFNVTNSGPVDIVRTVYPCFTQTSWLYKTGYIADGSFTLRQTASSTCLGFFYDGANQET